MDFISAHLLSIVTFLPLAGAVAVLLLPKDEHGQLRFAALLTSIIGFLVSIPLLVGYDSSAGGFQFRELAEWAPGAGLAYRMGIDGIAAILIVLTTFLAPIVILSAWRVTNRVKELMFCILLIQTAMVGSFAATDVMLFYVFWELVLIPMYLIIGVWGSENRLYAAIKLFVYTAAGSLMMLASILYLYWKTSTLPGGPSFDYEAFRQVTLTGTEQAWLFAAFALAFAIKVPIFPVHTWLPDAHVQAPAAGSIILAGVLLKMGTFGFVRYAMPLFPDALDAYAPFIGWLGAIGIVYGSLMSMAQRDMKKLVAYSSVAHLGVVVLGLMARTDESLTGAVLQMVNHGISTSALFLILGFMYDRRHTRQISEYGGQAKATPVMAALFLVITMSSIGLPTTNGFVGEFLVLSGTFVSASKWGPWWSIVGTTGVILSAVYMLTLYQRLYLGPVTNPETAKMKDLSGHEYFAVVPLIVMIVFLGVYPQPFINVMKTPVAALAQNAEIKRPIVNIDRLRPGPFQILKNPNNPRVKAPPPRRLAE